MQTSTLQDSDKALSSVCSGCELPVWRGSDVTDCMLTPSIIKHVSRKLGPNITDLALKLGSLLYHKRRHWILDEGVPIEKAPQRDILSPEPDKRPE